LFAKPGIRLRLFYARKTRGKTRHTSNHAFRRGNSLGARPELVDAFYNRRILAELWIGNLLILRE
jgi:hypothetical protein